MPISFTCPQCGHLIYAEAEAAGKSMACPGCGQPVGVPAAGASAEPPVAVPCPKCGSPLRLVAQLHGRQVRCKSCQAVLAVSAAPLSLSVVAGTAAPTPSSLTPSGSPPPAPPLASMAPSAAGPAATPAVPPPLPPRAPGIAPSPPPEAPPAVWPVATPRPVVGRKPLWIGLAVLVALAVVLPVLGMLLSGSDARDALRYLPADCQAVASINVPEIRNSDLMKRIVAKLPEGRNWEDQLLRETGIAAGDVARITVGIGDFGGEQPIIVVSLSRAVDPRQLLQRPGQPTWSEEKIGDTVLYTQARAGTYFPNERTIVGGDVAALRRALSSPRENRPSGRLAAVVDSLDFSRTLTIVGVVPEGPLPLSDEIPVQPELLRRVSGFSVYADLRKDLEVAATLICQDSESAEQIRKIVDGLLTMFTQAPDLPEERRKLIESIQVSSSGATIQAKLTIGQDVLEKLADSVPTIPARGTDLPAEPSDGTVR